MSGTRGVLGFVSLTLIAASVLFLFFIVLSGVKNTTPLNKTYFLQADTSTIAGSGRPVSQWTFFYICGEGNTDCGSPVPALPFGYAWIGGSAGVPDALTGSHGKGTTSTHYYYLWRFGWVFYLIALVFDVLGLFTAILAPCSRLASGISGSILVIALFFMTLAASLMTAEFVQARNAFQNAGISASLGRYGFGWTWAAWFAILLAVIFLFAGCGAGGRSRRERNSLNTTTTSPRRGATGTGFWRRQRQRQSRGSFHESESQHRVKEEYV